MDKIENLIKLMIENEISISELYSFYGKQFPAFKFWNRLSKEEKMHALMLKKLFQKTDFENLAVDSKIFSNSEIAQVSKELKKIIKSASKDNMVEALQNALKIESTITEQSYFKVFIVKENSDFKKILDYLRNATKKHRDFIYNDLKKLLPRS